MREARVPDRRFSRPLFPILLFGSVLVSFASPDPIPAERVHVLGDAIRPVALRLGYADFIAQAESVARQRGVRIMASDLAKLAYPQSVYDRVPVSGEMLSQLRLTRPALEKLGIRVDGWKPQPEDMSGIPASNLRFLGDTAKVFGLEVKYDALVELALYYREYTGLMDLLDQGGGVTIGDVVDAGIPLAALDPIELMEVDFSEMPLRAEEALVLGALPPSAREIPITFGDLRRIGLTLDQMSGLRLIPDVLAALGEAATGRMPIDSGSRKSEGMPLSRLLQEVKDLSPGRRFPEPHHAHDSLRIDTLGFATLLFRDGTVFLRPQEGDVRRFEIKPAPIHAPDAYPAYARRRRLADVMAGSGVLPIVRAGFGYPEIAFGQVGLALTRLPIPFSDWNFPFAALQAGVAGFTGLLGQTEIHYGGGHSPAVFLAYALEYHQEWRDSHAWNAGPALQCGFGNVGFQAAIRFGREWGGESALLIQLFPPRD